MSETKGGMVPHSTTQRALTGVHWDLNKVELDRMPHVGTASALSRFRAALPDLIWNAAALEGNTFTLPEVRALLDGTSVDSGPLEDRQQILALSEGYSLIAELVEADTFTLDKATSDRVHALVARHEAIESGHFRGEGHVSGGGTVRLSTGGYIDGTATSELPERWTRLMDHLAGLSDPRERALAYNAAATRTQFYVDGNKRTARLMTAGELMSNGYEAVNIPYARRLEFNDALDELFQSNDATGLMAFMATCVDAGLPAATTPETTHRAMDH